MDKKGKHLTMFEGKQIRRHWDDQSEEWYFSVVDVVGVLSESDRPRKYWDDLKRRLINEGSEVSAKIGQLKLMAEDGKLRVTDVADTRTMFRLIQSIPSPNAEPFKLWLAKVGYERLEETADPELAITRALKTYLAKGYSPAWIMQRLKSIEMRKELTDEWEKVGVKEELQDVVANTEGHILLVSKEGDQIIGFALCYSLERWILTKPEWKKSLTLHENAPDIFSQPTLYFRQVAVLPGKEGPGQKLETQVFEEAKSRGYKYVVGDILKSPITNTRSMKIHQRRGFIPIGTVNDGELVWTLVCKELQR